MSRLWHFIRRLRFRWNASAHYHAWLFAQIPPGARSALDVGCGDGRFTRLLAARGLDVDALDRDSRMLDVARASPSSHVRWIHGDILSPEMPLREDGYDVVTVIATLHFMPSLEALARLRTLVAIDGALLVIGLYRADSVSDTITSILALPLHAAIGMCRRQWKGALVDYANNVPLTAPLESLRDIRAAADVALPRARVRRRLFWRYTLQWSEQSGGRAFADP